MDWTNVRRSQQSTSATPTEKTLETCWDDDLLRSQRAAEIGTAREIAEQWRQAVIAMGGFDELTSSELGR